MEIKYDKHFLQLISENPLDEVYLENPLGLKDSGDIAIAIRVPQPGMGSIWEYVNIQCK